MPKSLISVIIPVYNAEKTIERCVKSIVSHQASVEIICVDDGSADNSFQILNDLSKEDARLIVVHQTNSGAGEARNTGLKKAVGEYIMFCDADDCYAEDTIDLIAEDIKAYQQDYLVFHRKTVTLNGNTTYWGVGENVLKLECNWHEYLNTYMNQRSHGGVVGTKVFKRSIIEKNDIHFERFIFGEDIWFNLTYIRNAHSFVEDYRAYYIQYQTLGSICLRPYSNYIDLNMEYVEKFRAYFPQDYNHLRGYFANYYYGTLIWAITRIMDGVDAHGLSQKLSAVRNACFRRETSMYLGYLKEYGCLELASIKRCNDLLNKRYFKYLIRYYYLPKIKSAIVRIIR